IPKLEYYANNSASEVYNVLREIYFHHIIEDGEQYWSWMKPYFSSGGSKMKTTFVYDYDRYFYVTAYSTNLHIYGSEDVETSNS
ncbi:hypothetical protein NPIL_550111, partial [Nephila pilipes]